MSHVTMRHIAAVAASAALLSGAAAAAGSAAYADAPGHHGAGVSAEHKEEAHVTVHGDHDHGRHLGWEKGVDKKADHFDAKHKVWQRWDGDSRTYAQWDERTRSWERKYKGRTQHWDNAHKAWK